MIYGLLPTMKASLLVCTNFCGKNSEYHDAHTCCMCSRLRRAPPIAHSKVLISLSHPQNLQLQGLTATCCTYNICVHHDIRYFFRRILYMQQTSLRSCITGVCITLTCELYGFCRRYRGRRGSDTPRKRFATQRTTKQM